MDSPDPLGATRRSLHAIAETVLAGPQHRETGTIRLVVTPGGFATLPGGPRRLSVVGTELVVQDHGEARVVPLTGSLGEVAAAAGVDLGAPQGVYDGTTGATATDVLEVDAAAAALLADAFDRGDKA